MSWLFSGEQGKYSVDGIPADLRAHAPDTYLVDKRGWVDTISEDGWTHVVDSFSVSFSKPLGASSLPIVREGRKSQTPYHHLLIKYTFCNQKLAIIFGQRYLLSV